MKVVNRMGESMEVSYDEIKKRITRLTTDDDALQLGALDIDSVVIHTINGMYDGISTSELDELSARLCASLQSVHHAYDTLAARILVSNMAKCVRAQMGPDVPSNSFAAKVAYVARHAESTLDERFVAFVARHADALDGIVRYERDATQHSYFSLRTLVRSYLMRVGSLCIESPQDMWLRVAVAIHMPHAADAAADAADALARIRACYDAMSLGDYTHATPTLFNAGMRTQQCSSCFATIGSGRAAARTSGAPPAGCRPAP